MRVKLRCKESDPICVVSTVSVKSLCTLCSRQPFADLLQAPRLREAQLFLALCMHIGRRVVVSPTCGTLVACRRTPCPVASFATSSRPNELDYKVKAVTLNDLSIERTVPGSFVETALADTCQHPVQLPDDRQLLQGYVLQRSQLDTASVVLTQEQVCVCYSCELSSAPLNVAVLLSGGVDSSFALHLLKRAGHHVTAFYLQIWFQEDFRNYWDSCPWEDDLSYCQQVISTNRYSKYLGLRICCGLSPLHASCHKQGLGTLVRPQRLHMAEHLSCICCTVFNRHKLCLLTDLSLWCVYHVLFTYESRSQYLLPADLLHVSPCKRSATMGKPLCLPAHALSIVLTPDYS